MPAGSRFREHEDVLARELHLSAEMIRYRRQISGGTMSTAGRAARDVLLGLMKTCRKLSVSFFGYLGDRLRVPGAAAVPPLPDLVTQAASTA